MQAQLNSAATSVSQTQSRQQLLKLLAGFIAIYAVFEGSSRILLALGVGRPASFFIIASLVVITAFVTEMLLFKQSLAQAALRLGLGQTPVRVLAVAALIGVLMLVCYPLISAATGFSFPLPSNTVLMFLGVFVMNGIAEEMMVRGYLFRHLRATRTFGRALLWVMLIHGAIHVIIMLEAGVLVGTVAVITALATGVTFAYVFERGNNTIWAPALLHFVADTIVVLIPANGMAQPGGAVATVLWMGVIIFVPYLVLIFRRRLFNLSNSTSA